MKECLPVGNGLDLAVHNRKAFARGAALVLPIGVAAAMVPFRASFAAAASALVLVAVVVGVAAFGDRFAGYLATIMATLSFDFFLTRPYERLAITHRPDIETAVCLFVVGVVVTEICVQSRRVHEAAREGSEFVGLIAGVAELASSGSVAGRGARRGL